MQARMQVPHVHGRAAWGLRPVPRGAAHAAHAASVALPYARASLGAAARGGRGGA
jgi:hypothetical protein